jgi:hypothetical protein
MDTLIKELRARKHDVRIKNQETYAIIEETEMKISLRETTKRVAKPDKWDRFDWIATGILCFKMDNYSHQKEWKDGSKLIEQQLPEIIAKLELEGRERKIEREKNELFWAEQNRKKEIEKELENLRKIELQKFNDLLSQAKRFQEATMIRNYVDAVEANSILEDNLTQELKDWINWARTKSDAYDPLFKIQDT